MWQENRWNVIYEVRGANRGLTLNKKTYLINCSLRFWMQGTVTMQNDVKSSSSTSHEPSRLVTLNRERSLFNPRVVVGGGKIWLFHDKIYLLPLPPPALYDSPSPWWLMASQFSKVPLYGDNWSPHSSLGYHMISTHPSWSLTSLVHKRILCCSLEGRQDQKF